MAELKSALEAILFASGESIPAARLSLVLGRDLDEIQALVIRDVKRFVRRQDPELFSVGVDHTHFSCPDSLIDRKVFVVRGYVEHPR